MSEVVIKVYLENESMKISVDYGNESICDERDDQIIDLVRFQSI